MPRKTPRKNGTVEARAVVDDARQRWDGVFRLGAEITDRLDCLAFFAVLARL